MANQRVAGTIALQVNGEVQNAKGEFEYGFGAPKRTAIVGSDRIHGYKEDPQVAFIEGKITDRQDLDVDALVRGKDLTVNLRLGNGKMAVLRDAFFAGDGNVNTGEGEIGVRWEGAGLREVTP